MEIKQNVLEIADLYDTFFIDVFGVLFDGSALYSGTLQTLKQLKKMGKNVVIVSNTSQRTETAERGYSEWGIIKDLHYDYFVSAGEVLHECIMNNSQKIEDALSRKLSTIKCLFLGNSEVFTDTYITKVDSLELADMVYVPCPRTRNGMVRVDDLFDQNNEKVPMKNLLCEDWRTLKNSEDEYVLAEFYEKLEYLSGLKKILLIANPDITAHNTVDGHRHLTLAQGGIGIYYEKHFGGKVVYYGKPYADIFELAKSKVNSSGKTVMIGDTLWTDIFGARKAEIDSALVLTGITGEILPQLTESSFEEKIYHISRGAAEFFNEPAPVPLPDHYLNRFAKD